MNTFGSLFRVSILGESHGDLVGVLIDGCPAGLGISPADFEPDLARRRSGAAGTTSRHESDQPQLLSGIFNGCTTGAPILINFKNGDTRPADYSQLKDLPRPGHADLTARQKFGGFNDFRGGGHLSGRLTVALAAAGVLAKKLIAPIEISAHLAEAGGEADFEKSIKRALEEGDSIGGLIECHARNLPSGLGEPFFDSVESLLSHALFSIPAVKAVEFGSGFAAAGMRGSEFNDEILDSSGRTATNHCGGINGGISNGNPLFFRVAVRPASSIKKQSRTVNLATGERTGLSVPGRHDACIALRVPVLVEAVTAIVLSDLMLREQKLKRVRS
jgi:chorismate synthase